MRFSIFLTIFFASTIIWIFMGIAEEKHDKIDDSILEESTKTYDIKAIPKKIRENYLELKKCYTNELSKNKNLREGEIIINFTITEKGDTSNVNIKSSEVKDKNVETCITSKVSKIIFPPSSEGEIEVNYPFNCSYKDKSESTENPVNEKESNPTEKKEKVDAK